MIYRKLIFLLFLAGCATGVSAAELIIKIGDSEGALDFKDGDVIHAFNDKRIQARHAESIIREKHRQDGRAGVRLPEDHLLKTYYEETHEFKFERLDEKVVRRTNLWTGVTETFSDIPNKNGKQMDVPLFIKRRLRHERHSIFGSNGSEFWYGGRVRYRQSDVDDLWTEIEAKTSFLKSDHTQWPFTDNELKAHLAITVSDMTDAKMREYENPKLDLTNPDNPVITARRAKKVNWRNLAGLGASTRADVESKTTKVDVRGQRTHTHETIVETKLAALIP
jgi:hypothetical protein